MKTSDMTDEALMDILRQGNESGLAELVRRYQNDIYRFCLRYLREAESAREVTQETFIRIYVARERFDVTRKFRAWALCIARNLCMNELKRKKTVPMVALEEYASASRTESGEVLRYSGEGPDETIMTQERRSFIRQAMADLPPDARELLVLRFFEQLSARDIAEVLKSTEGAVRTRLHRLLADMRGQYRTQRDVL